MAGGCRDASGGFKNFKQICAPRRPADAVFKAINGVDDDPRRDAQEIVFGTMYPGQVEIRRYRDDDVMNTVALKDIGPCVKSHFRRKTRFPSVGESTFEGISVSMIDFSTILNPYRAANQLHDASDRTSVVLSYNQVQLPKTDA